MPYVLKFNNRQTDLDELSPYFGLIFLVRTLTVLLTMKLFCGLKHRLNIPFAIYDVKCF